ncbi:MAG: YlmH/Sll1252 family protein [Clostridia bacterium]|nr:YlmH/Sll1252 family protein [Clostridia bacterium]
MPKNADKEIIDKIKGKATLCEKKGIVAFTDFLDPIQLETGKALAKPLMDTSCFSFGGYEDSERNILIFHPYYVEREKIEYPIKAISIHNKTSPFQHRSVLGAILGLGLKREKIGDILTDNHRADVILYKEAAEVVLLFLNKVGNQNVTCQEISFEQMNTKSIQYKWIHATVASLRVDAIISCGFGQSRRNSSEVLKSGRVKVNYKEIDSPGYLLKEGDQVSVRGKGRVLLEKVDGLTKKERIKVVIRRVL